MPHYEYGKDHPFAAFITSLGKDNEGSLVGEWVQFPTTAEELQKVFEPIGIGCKDDFGQPLSVVGFEIIELYRKGRRFLYFLSDFPPWLESLVFTHVFEFCSMSRPGRPVRCLSWREGRAPRRAGRTAPPQHNRRPGSLGG